jgi:TPR repeat protein
VLAGEAVPWIDRNRIIARLSLQRNKRMMQKTNQPTSQKEEGSIAMHERFGLGTDFGAAVPKKKLVRILLCLFGAMAICALNGCTAAVPYAISAAQLVSVSGALSEPSSTAQPARPLATTNTEENRPYQLIAEKKYDEALPILRERADRQDPKAQNQLALLYYEGKGVPEDDGKAAEWMRKAAEGGDATSQYMLAWFSYKGIGVPQDYAKSLEWAQKAMEMGDTNATTLLARLHRLGRGVPQNYTKALELLHAADQAGSIYAPAHIAYMYKTGQGVSKDYRQAIEWYSKAAEKGNTSGWTHLAYLYATCKDSQYVDGKRAVAYGLKATERDPNHFSSWAALAAAYARNNQFDKAIEAAAKSDNLLQANTKLNDDEKQEIGRRAQIRLTAFKDNKAYTEENEADQEN